MSNLPPPPRSRFSCGPGAVSGGKPLVSSSSTVVPTFAAIVTPSSNRAGSLALVPIYCHSENEDVVPPIESLEPIPWMDKGK